MQVHRESACPASRGSRARGRRQEPRDPWRRSWPGSSWPEPRPWFTPFRARRLRLPAGSWGSGPIGSTSIAPGRERRRSCSSRVSAAPRSTGSGFSPRSPDSPGRAATTARATAGASLDPSPAMRIGLPRSWIGFSCTRASRLPMCWSGTPSADSPFGSWPRARNAARWRDSCSSTRPTSTSSSGWSRRACGCRWRPPGGDSSSRTTGWCRAHCPSG